VYNREMNDDPITYDDFVRMVKELEETLPVNPDYFYLPLHPDIWNGYWDIHERSRLLRRLGRRLHSRRIYWLGLYVKWITGVKEWQ
jgi:hypothetical protein